MSSDATDTGIEARELRPFYFPPPQYIDRPSLHDNAAILTAGLANTGDLDQIHGFINAVLATLQGNPGAMLDWIAQTTGEWVGDFGDWALGLAADFTELLAALTGRYEGDDAVLAHIQAWSSGIIAKFTDLRDALAGDYTGDDIVLRAIQSWSNALSSAINAATTFVQNVLDAILQGIRGIPIVGGSIADIIESITGLNRTAETAASTAHDAVERVGDAETRLDEYSDRLDLLDQVSGFASMYLTKNWRVAGSGKLIALPFDGQVGPAKRCTPESGDIRLEKGTWTASALVEFTGYTIGSGTAAVYIQVDDPHGTQYTRKRLAFFLAAGNTQSAFLQNTFVTPESGYTVRVFVAHSGTWTTVYGGTVRSMLTVNRWDIDVSNAVVDPDVPDGGDLT